MAHVEDRWLDSDGQPTARHGRGKRWRLRWVDPDGRERSRSYERKRDADREQATVTADVLRGVYLDPDAGRRTLRDYADEWLAGYRPASQRSRDIADSNLRCHILPTLGDRAVATIKPTAVRQLLSNLELAPNTVRSVYGTLRAVLAAAVDDGLIASSPCDARSVQAPAVVRRRVEPWPVKLCDAVDAALPGHLAVLVPLGRALGLRQGEAFGLAVDDVDFLRGVVHVRRQVTSHRGRPAFAPPKGGRQRDVPLGELVGQRIAEHLREHRAQTVTLAGQSARLIVHTDGRPLRRSTFNDHRWKPALHAAGLIAAREVLEDGKLGRWPEAREHGFHALRHTYASVLLAGGVSIGDVAEWMGHHDPAFTLRIYRHLMPESVGRARSILDASLDVSRSDAAGAAAR